MDRRGSKERRRAIRLLSLRTHTSSRRRRWSSLTRCSKGCKVTRGPPVRFHTGWSWHRKWPEKLLGKP